MFRCVFGRKRAIFDDFYRGKHAHRQKSKKHDFSIFSRFLRRQMKSDMVGMPNQVYIPTKGCVNLHSAAF